ncbi:hypothetical protein [Streptomyces flavofungini]|uniref:hypothetical protein n=1 Tax=Streptomyces flavofungini TaxID=68200 RepID=UPI001E318B63|nr:hypothetical protein [Streptomyces flavofungini]
MADERSSLSGTSPHSRTYISSRTPGASGRWRPPPALLGFLVLLVVVFAVAYQVGSSMGPVAPGMRSSTPEDGSGGDRDGGSGGGHGGGHGGHGQ